MPRNVGEPVPDWTHSYPHSDPSNPAHGTVLCSEGTFLRPVHNFPASAVYRCCHLVGTRRRKVCGISSGLMNTTCDTRTVPLAMSREFCSVKLNSLAPFARSHNQSDEITGQNLNGSKLHAFSALWSAVCAKCPLTATTGNWCLDPGPLLIQWNQ